jgi:predicted esterase
MRLLVPAVLFAAVCVIVVKDDALSQQPDPKNAPQRYDPPKASKPDEATLKRIAEKTDQLRKAIDGLKSKNVLHQNVVEVEIYLKAAENIVRFEEWYAETSGKWATQTLEQGLERARQAEGGNAPWRDSPGKWVLRAYQSQIDDSIQPYAVLLPHDYGKDPKKKWRLDIVLHGRDAALTEAKFIAAHGSAAKAAAKELDHVQLEVYGRGNNAYRWAGERDVFEALQAFLREDQDRINLERLILRGFSMGGAGTWQIGLHYPFWFAAIGPGAGFTTTHGYVGGMPKQLPEYQEKCLRIYDAVDYAENAFNVPVVAYSGSKDPQKAAADNIENALKGFPEPLRFTHLVAPGLEHQMPKEWQDQAEAEFKKYLPTHHHFPDNVRFVTYTTRYNFFGHGWIHALEHHYEKAVIESHWSKEEVKIKTENIRFFRLGGEEHPVPATVILDGVEVQTGKNKRAEILFEKRAGKWVATESASFAKELHKGAGPDRGLQGPIDDAFTARFQVVPPSGPGWNPAISQYLTIAQKQFAHDWDKYFRGQLPSCGADRVDPQTPLSNLVLFGDPDSNPLIAKVLPQLPITWTKDRLIVNGVEYDAKTHVPVMIYPNPLSPHYYVVLNSGHTFKEADLKGTNALLYPRLGDWAVLKPTPTAKDSAAYEVVDAGLFDESWHFAKQK